MIGKKFKYPDCEEIFTLKEIRTCSYHFECGHWCTDSVFMDLTEVTPEMEYLDFLKNKIKIAETLELHGKLPTSFMLLQPQSWNDDVWTDITRMLTLNSSQWSKGKEMHLCPLQFDIVDRVIEQMSNVGDIVYDPFS